VGFQALYSNWVSALGSLPSIPFASEPSVIEELSGLRIALSAGLPAGARSAETGPRLLIKRDDALPFAFGGNKIRKMQLVAAQAKDAKTHRLITCGGLQSNHARVTAAVGAKLGIGVILIVNTPDGLPPPRPTANALLDSLLGAEVRYVATREGRAAAMEEAAAEVRQAGKHPYVVPLGASTPLGAAGFALAIEEMLRQIPPPDVIIHASSSGGTQAGLIAGCALAGVRTRVIGISADEPAGALRSTIAGILDGLEPLAGVPRGRFTGMDIEIDDTFVGGGYGAPTPASREAIELVARSEAIFLDPTYTAKAMAGLIAYCRRHVFSRDQTVLFWHTGGQVGLFA
jgi:1-aminocyclopropane-1-carboxylate deaminase/D-cysteine desulfhydrase-like pyridoxal-dependent ACC family enzyme